jgi:hypothetical protein
MERELLDGFLQQPEVLIDLRLIDGPDLHIQIIIFPFLLVLGVLSSKAGQLVEVEEV